MSTEAVQEVTTVEDFRYTDLNEVDPTFKAIPAKVYTLQVLSGVIVDTTAKKNSKRYNIGDPVQFVKFSFGVVGDPNYTGRRVFAQPLFFNAFALRAMRNLMDKTGVYQEPGTSLDTWLEKLTIEQPLIKLGVTEIPNRNDPNVTDNDVDWKVMTPAI